MACGLKPFIEQREKVIPFASGEVLELGIGSGLNLPYYDSAKVSRIVGVDPDDHMWKRSEARRAACPIPVERIGISGENIPLHNTRSHKGSARSKASLTPRRKNLFS